MAGQLGAWSFFEGSLGWTQLFEQESRELI